MSLERTYTDDINNACLENIGSWRVANLDLKTDARRPHSIQEIALHTSICCLLDRGLDL